jgi:ATP-dependent DNA helicase RecG
MNQVGSKINILLTTSQKSGGQESVKKTAEKKQFSTYKGNASRNRIIDIIEHNPFVTSMEIAEDLGINRSAVQKHLAKLTTDGWLRRTGPKKTGRWVVVAAIEL